jgi:hypothetical protein
LSNHSKAVPGCYDGLRRDVGHVLRAPPNRVREDVYYLWARQKAPDRDCPHC